MLAVVVVAEDAEVGEDATPGEEVGEDAAEDAEEGEEEDEPTHEQMVQK